MTRRMVVLTCLVLGAVAAQARAGDPPHVTILVDCSRHMEAPLGADAKAKSRLSAAQDAATRLLETLAADGRHNVSLMLYGEKVTAVHESQPFTGDDLANFRKAVKDIKPAGDANVLLAIDQAAQAIPQDDAGIARVVVLTSGESDESEDTVTTAAVLKSLSAANAEAHIIQLGADDKSDLATELHEIADTTEGAIYSGDTASSVAKAVQLAAGLQPANPKVAAVAKPKPATVDPRVRPVVKQEAVPPALEPVEAPAADRICDVRVEVTYHGAPVTDAKIYLRGENFDLVYDRIDERTSRTLRLKRLSGEYFFKSVPYGPYTMEIVANVKNRKYVVLREFSVDDDSDARRTFKIQLEKTKDPLFAPAIPVPPPVP